MPVNTLKVANRLKAAEKQGRMAEELALVLGEFEVELQSSSGLRACHGPARPGHQVQGTSRRLGRPDGPIKSGHDRWGSIVAERNGVLEAADHQPSFPYFDNLARSLTWRFAWMLAAMVTILAIQEIFFT